MAVNTNKNSLLALQARGVFTDQAIRILPELSQLILEHFSSLLDQFGSALEAQQRRDAWLAYKTGGPIWVEGVIRAWKKAQAKPLSAASRPVVDAVKFELMAKEVIENKILSSRLALRLLDSSSRELNDLRLRVQSLDGLAELPEGDVLRPETLSGKLLEEWVAATLSRESWVLVQQIIQDCLAEHFLEAYHAANEFLVKRGVMAEIDLRLLVKRTPSSISDAKPRGAPASVGDIASAREQTDFQNALHTSVSNGVPDGGLNGVDTDQKSLMISSLLDETRVQSNITPLTRARQRAQVVMGHLKRMLSKQVAGFDETQAVQASVQLTQAIVDVNTARGSAGHHLLAGTPDQVYSPVDVAQAADVLREQSSSLKKAASTSREKATIEVVALMFQGILAEERIPPTIRVWFARLQMPVLRVAISEPDFFGSLQHPARLLIDRMGSCVLGFDSGVTGSAMGIEIKRMVQVIEQYPETGRRVFQLVYDEFQKFLSKTLSEQGSAARVVSIALQVERKETLTIQYTIELRRMLNDLPVRDEIRDFLFKIWAEVLAIAAMRNGPQNEETIALKRAAADLVWAASAKSNRVERAKVIADLPKLLQLLRSGMSMLGLEDKTQDGHAKLISETLADAFNSKTDAIAKDRIDEMARRLSNLEDYLSDDDVGDLPLDSESLVTMIGIDASDIEIIADGGSQPTEVMREWVKELQLGAWFSLEHNKRKFQVQFAWRSERKQLHLFASTDGRNILIQARRLAAYLQAGLLVPTEEEALTIRATRDALAKLDANPERLLG